MTSRLPSFQLAKRKADDLEDFSENRESPVVFFSGGPSRAIANLALPSLLSADAANTTATTLSPAAIAEGTALVEQFLNAWASVAPASSAPAPTEGEDVEMANGEGEGDAEVERDYAALVKCFAEYKDRFEETEWTKKVLEQTY